jgi:fused signal recognition particle receptor
VSVPEPEPEPPADMSVSVSVSEPEPTPEPEPEAMPEPEPDHRPRSPQDALASFEAEVSALTDRVDRLPEPDEPDPRPS